jgi:formylglycine-generating enzyme required for sulfatase activity/tRNA A-37 threonylcarbamoyl transferase component Bud32
MNEQIDDIFLQRARERGLLSESQVRDARSELAQRRRQEPELGAHELAVEKGWIGVEAALALLEAGPNDTIADLAARISEGSLQPMLEPDLLEQETSSDRGDTRRYDATSELELDPGDEQFDEIPRLVEPLAPTYAVADSSASDSHLEMELPPPAPSSGDSLFEENESEQLPALETEFDQPQIVGEKTPTMGFDAGRGLQPMEVSDTALGDVDNLLRDLDSDDLQLGDLGNLDEEEEVLAIEPPASSGDTLLEDQLRPRQKDTERYGAVGAARSDPGRTASDTALGLSGIRGAEAPGAAHAPAPAFAMRASKGATEDFASFGDDDSSEAPETEETSVRMADSAVNEVMEQADDGYFGPPADLTVTPPELLEDSIAPPRPADGATLFDSESLKAAIPVAGEEEDFAATTPPRGTEQDDSSITLPGEFPTDASTVYDDSNVSLEDVTDESEVTTGSRTQFATGEQARPGLRNRSESKLGVESNITRDSDVVTGQEMTLADLRAQMGIGAGVKIGAGEGAMGRLKGGKKKRYSVIREIARGGMGKVIEVEDNDLRRSVALKVLRKEMLDRKDLVERFLEEAQITGQLEHPNIVPVHEIGVDGRGNLYFTMKLVEGEELSSILKRLRKNDPSAQQAYPVSRLVDIFIKVCEGVAFAHSRGVIHRDLKPANIMVGRFGEVQIMDWGVAKIVGRKEDTADREVRSDRQDDDAARTMAGSILGTPSYMSPEQARGEVNTMGPESDVFSLGVILYELLCLVTPWTAQTSAQVLDQVKNFEPEPPIKRAPERKIPPELEQLAMKCIIKQPHKRVRSVQELIDDLRAWQEGRTLAAVEYSLGQLIGKWISRHKVGLIMILLVIGALSAGGVLAYNAAQQAAIDRANELVAVADQDAAGARSALDAQDYEKADKLAQEAIRKYDSAILTLGEDDDALAARQAANNVSSEARVAITIAEKERQRAEQQKQAEKDFDQALQAADQAMADAQAAETAGEPAARQRQLFENAQDSYRQVQAVKLTGRDEDKAKVVQALGEISGWLKDFEDRRQAEDELTKLRGLVADAGKEHKAAAGLKPEQYSEASQKLVQVISLCDQAIAVNVGGAAGDRLRGDALDIKAQAALDFALRAMEGGHYDVADLMLNTARGTGRLPEKLNAARTVLDKKIEEQSRFTRLLVGARQRIAERSWVLAQSDIQAALKEAETSEYATDKDRAELLRMLQLARLEELRTKDQRARTSEELSRVLDGYDALLPELSDPDYNTRALTYQDEIIARLGAALYNEGLGSEDDRVKGELLERALEFTRDKAIVADINAQLTDIKLRVALKQVSEELVLLPRGSFVVGSNREGDNNPQRVHALNGFVFIDRYLVTNELYKQFIDAGAYGNSELWPEEVVPYLSLFVDATGAPGPASWSKGGFDPSLAKHPVTGLSWFEAAAYAKWAGKRLPTPEEWEVAGGAPRTDDAGENGDYPFGARENGPADGVSEPREVGTTEWDRSVLGVRDLGSNVAEWTAERADNRVTVKGAEPGLRPELFFRYARRTKHSVAQLLDRSTGRGFRCAQDFKLNEDEGSDD